MSEIVSTASAGPATTYGLVGAGGFGREIMPVLADMLGYRPGETKRRLVFVVEDDDHPAQVNGFPVMPFAQFLRRDEPRYFNVAIADSRERERIANACLQAGMEPVSIISRHSVILDANAIGEGAILAPFTTITSNATVGRFFHANLYSYVAHDCQIGDFVTFAPAVRCNGRIVVGDHAYLGTNAVLMPGQVDKPLVIGEGAVVGMGAVILKDVAPYTTVVGNPARSVGC